LVLWNPLLESYPTECNAEYFRQLRVLYSDFVALKPTLQQLETDTDNPSRELREEQRALLASLKSLQQPRRKWSGEKKETLLRG
jgi:hypothetical protein